MSVNPWLNRMLDYKIVRHIDDNRIIPTKVSRVLFGDLFIAAFSALEIGLWNSNEAKKYPRQPNNTCQYPVLSKQQCEGAIASSDYHHPYPYNGSECGNWCPWMLLHFNIKWTTCITIRIFDIVFNRVDAGDGMARFGDNDLPHTFPPAWNKRAKEKELTPTSRQCQLFPVSCVPLRNLS